MQMHLCGRHLKACPSTDCTLYARCVCVCVSECVVGQLVSPSVQTDRHMSRDDVMDQIRLFMHCVRE